MNKDLAICYGGQPRCMRKGFDDIKKLMDGTEHDTFAHVWDSKDLLSSWGYNMGWENRQTIVDSVQDFVDLYKPAKFITEQYQNSDFYENTSKELGYRNMANKIFSSMSQFYSMMKSFNLILEYEKENGFEYKYLAKFRMDFDIDWNVTTETWDEIKFRIDANPNLILVNPGWNWPDGDGISALLAIGGREAMLKYSKFYDYYPWITQNNPNWSYDESNIKMYVQKICGLDVEECQISVGVYR